MSIGNVASRVLGLSMALVLAWFLACVSACAQDDGQGQDQGRGQESASAASLASPASSASLASPVSPASPVSSGSSIARLEYQQLLEVIDSNPGKVVVVNFWATWCPPCRLELPELVALRSKYTEDQLIVLGVSVDESMAQVEGFLRETPLNFPTYWRTADLLAAYQVSGVPHTVVYDRHGRQAGDMSGYIPGEVEALVGELIRTD